MTIITRLVSAEEHRKATGGGPTLAVTKGMKTAAAACFEITIGGNLMDMLKIEKQRDYRTSYRTIIKKFSSQGYLRANLHGLYPWGFAMYGSRGLVYGTAYTSLDKFLSRRTGNVEKRKILAGVGAGMFEGAATTPFAYMRTMTAQKVMTGYSGKIDIKTLLRSMPFNAAKRGGDWGIRTAAYNRLTEQIDPIPAAFTAGVVSSVITMPVDRLVPLLQKENPPPSIVKWVTESVRKDGFAPIFAGGWARLSHAGWHTLFIFGALHIMEGNKLLKY